MLVTKIPYNEWRCTKTTYALYRPSNIIHGRRQGPGQQVTRTISICPCLLVIHTNSPSPLHKIKVHCPLSIFYALGESLSRGSSFSSSGMVALTILNDRLTNKMPMKWVPNLVPAFVCRNLEISKR